MAHVHASPGPDRPSERPSGPGDAVGETRAAWGRLSAYERFEQAVTLVLTTLIALVIVAALVTLTLRVGVLLASGLVDPANQEVLQGVFGMILTVLIALEFNHSILSVLHRAGGVVQCRALRLIPLLPLLRTFLILAAAHVAPLTVTGLAAAILALGVVPWLVRDQDRREAADQAGAARDA